MYGPESFLYLLYIYSSWREKKSCLGIRYTYSTHCSLSSKLLVWYTKPLTFHLLYRLEINFHYDTYTSFTSSGGRICLLWLSLSGPRPQENSGPVTFLKKRVRIPSGTSLIYQKLVLACRSSVCLRMLALNL